MSSAESNLQWQDMEDMEKSGSCGFTFIWSIHNFSSWASNFHCLISPNFEIEFFKDVEWWLNFRSSGDDDDDFISIFIKCSAAGTDTSCKFALSIHKSDGQFKKGGYYIFDHSIFTPGNGWLNAFSLEELQGPGGYLDNDTLTVQCRVWRVDTADISVPVKCHARTRLAMQKLDFIWELDGIEVSNNKLDYNKLNQSIKVPIKDCALTGIKLQVLNEVDLNVDAIHFGIKLLERKISPHDFDIVFVYTIHLLDGEGIIVHSLRGKHLFRKFQETEMLDPLISISKLYKNEQMYMPNGRLTLRCLLSYANVYSQVVECSITRNFLPKPALPYSVSGDYDIWKENLLKFYNEGKFRNAIVQTPSKMFFVNRDILCAQSKVFSAKIEQDMKEKKRDTGVIDIADLEKDIVCKMLRFIHTNTLEDIDFNTAQKLYMAADQYGVTALQNKCSNILMGYLHVSNVCDILALACKYSDKTLKLKARDFIDIHASEIVVSDGWKKLMETNSSLTCEIYHWMFCNKFLNP